jgi:hypothetical protein
MLLAIGALAFWCVERMTRALLLRAAGPPRADAI